MASSRPFYLHPNLLRLAVAALVVVALGATATVPADASDTHGQLRIGGKARTYAVHVPAHPAPAGGYPVVLAFHGGGLQGDAMRRLARLDGLADRRGFIVVYPDAINGQWNDGRLSNREPQDDVAFVDALLDRLGREHPIDAGRVYAAGMSGGALFAERLGCELSPRIAGIAAVAGTMAADLAADCRPAHPVAALHINGTDDPIMPFDGGAVAGVGGRGEGGAVLSAARTVGLWAEANGCRTAGTPHLLRVVAPLDPTQTVRTAHVDCPATGPVMQLTVMGGGHAWPGAAPYARTAIVGRTSRQFDASVAIADFFLALPVARGRQPAPEAAPAPYELSAYLVSDSGVHGGVNGEMNGELSAELNGQVSVYDVNAFQNM